MFGLFKKKTEREKLMISYKSKKKQAFELSKINNPNSSIIWLGEFEQLL